MAEIQKMVLAGIGKKNRKHKLRTIALLAEEALKGAASQKSIYHLKIILYASTEVLGGKAVGMTKDHINLAIRLNVSPSTAY